MRVTRIGWALGASLLLTAAACDSPGSVVCGPGTVQVGSQCVAGGPDGMGMMMNDPPPTPPPSGGTDAGPGGGTMDPPPPMGGADAGPDFRSTPPGPMGRPPSPGCDTSDGDDCAAWADALAALIASHEGRGCGDDLTRPSELQGIAERHAQHQASVDMLDPTSPDGDLFRQIRDADVVFMNAGALFSVGNYGAEDVMDRWLDGADTTDVLDQCWTMAGVGFATGESGWSYATVILAR